MPNMAPYGSWKSPITAELVSAKVVSLMEVCQDGDDTYWIEGHPAEGGRHTIMRAAPDGSIKECTPPEWYVRTTVHEYGGGAYAVHQWTIYFVNFADQRIYRQDPDSQPRLLTPTEGYRFADLVVDAPRDRLICIREDHTVSGEAVNSIVAIPIAGGSDGLVLASGNDFYSSARLSPDGTRLAYLTWNHPNMPWDGCELRLASIAADGTLSGDRRIAGGSSESVFQPEWSPDGILHFVAETTGWWNVYRLQGERIEALYPMDAEFGAPQWQFGASTYGFVSPSRILCSYSEGGFDHLAWIDTVTKTLTPEAPELTDISSISCGGRWAAFIAGSPTDPPAIVRMDPRNNSVQIIRRAFEPEIGPAYLSRPEAITYPTSDDRQAHAMYYPPHNEDCKAPAGDLPPLIVWTHGGPTAAAGTALRYGIQYWTSRGFAVVDVNYGGSTGYGREYRRRLLGQWGVVDVDDCCNAARYLVARGLVDGRRLVIRGGSAGGFTTLACLTFRNDVFSVGASYFGLADLEIFVHDTHKFESRYLTSLVGLYPERKDLYIERSPIHAIDKLSAPMILFQGSEDRVVPPNQSQMMFDALRRKGVPVAYLEFEGEQHGFRRAENIKRAAEAELYFYSKVLGFEPADVLEPVAIENL
jgi:dipeptidyl aminopeptidase/acylaminoacyl peptidase